MTTYNGFKAAALAASIALTLGSPMLVAATTPVANQLPGQGEVVMGSIDTAATGVSADGKTLTVALTAISVIDWGTGTDINQTGTAGFNIGSGAKVNFIGGKHVLNIDSTGNPSQILGALANTGGNLFVANSNGIIVGTGASINAPGIALVANELGPTTGFAGQITAPTFSYNGIGGDVTVEAGVVVTGDFFVSGGGNVNVDLGGVTGPRWLSAGLPSGGGSFATKNALASLTVTGGGTGTMVQFGSAGTATTKGIVNLAGITTNVAGVLTNIGDLTLAAVNNAVHNRGQLRSSGAVRFTALTNDGDYVATGIDAISVKGGDLINNGMVTASGAVAVINGSIVNNGTITGAFDFEVKSDSTLASFTEGADYSISNTGTITSPASMILNANDQLNQTSADGPGELNGSTGSFTNSGKLQVAGSGALYVYASRDINLGGLVQTSSSGTVKAISATNPLGALDLRAAGYFLHNVFTSDGVLTVSTPLFVNAAINLQGNQVKLMDNVSGVDATREINIVAGAAQATDYAVRVASGKTVSAGTIHVDGDKPGNEPNVILQGTLSGNRILFGSSHRVSDVFSGPAGGLSMYGTLAMTPVLTLDFTGAVKTAKYNNASNFRFNGLAVNVTDGSPLYVLLNPSAYQTNGTSNGLSAVNLLVNSDVDLASGIGAAVLANGTAVTGVTNTPNTHLVLQSSGDIRVGDGGDFYWPGYVYLGNVAADADADADADGHALPGTLGLGAIATDGDFNNVLPGDVAGASGIHFVTQFPLSLGGEVVTNANAWVNFGTDLLAQAHAAGMVGTGRYFGGVQGPGLVVNYGPLDPALFHANAPDATR